jgi:hypothetical protein
MAFLNHTGLCLFFGVHAPYKTSLPESDRVLLFPATTTKFPSAMNYVKGVAGIGRKQIPLWLFGRNWIYEMSILHCIVATSS